MSTNFVEELTIHKVHEAFQRGDYTSEQLVEAYLSRIEQIDRQENGPKLNSLLALNQNAITEARSLDDSFRLSKKLQGPLHGVPVILKDQFLTKGTTTTFGSIAAQGFVPMEDATVVVKLRKAGAIVLAKSTMADWAIDNFSQSSASGFTRNPYALDRDAGGSSCGTAASIAANLGLIGIGEDSNGSIRLPASFCNLVGLRPTVGLISRAGVLPLVRSQDTPGPMCRTVTDVALTLDSLVGFDEEDEYTSINSLNPTLASSSSYASQLGQEKLSEFRLGVVREYFGDEDAIQNDPEQQVVAAIMQNTLKTLQIAGCQLVDVEVPPTQHFLGFTPALLPRFRKEVDDFIKPLLGMHLAEIFAKGQAPSDNPAVGAVALGPGVPEGDALYGQLTDQRDDLERAVMSLMMKANVSALIFPTVRVAAPLQTSVPQINRVAFPSNTLLSSLTHMPGISVPVGFTSNDLPVGLELVGQPLSEQKLLNLAYGIEQLTKARKAPSF